MGTDPGPRGTGSDSGRRIGVLISGRGSNLQALIDAVADGSLDTQIAVVISNKADAGGLNRARAAGIETLILDHRSHASRGEHDAEIARKLKARGVSLVCLAGFMRLIGTRCSRPSRTRSSTSTRRCCPRFLVWTPNVRRSNTE